ncbi:MAG TPA: hypothetical protein VK826_15085 [Bacteroidia bacterium]|nr:hypothetical protein [Bacteroidia bacterium]
MKTAILSLFLWTATVLPALAQSPPHSDKLATDQGFKALKIGAKLSDVKQFLMKDTMARSTSFEPNDGLMDYEQAIYLVDLKKPGYGEFYGRKIVRIEVYFSDLFNESEGDTKTIDVVKIFVDKGGEDGFTDMVSLVNKAYGNGTYTFDFPGPGCENWTWWCEDVLMGAVNWYGSSEDPKLDYYKIEFSSAKGG